MMLFHTLVSYFQLKHEIEVWKTMINIIKIYLKYEISILFHYLKDYLMTKLTLGQSTHQYWIDISNWCKPTNIY
jgi:hypothetical protein